MAAHAKALKYFHDLQSFSVSEENSTSGYLISYFLDNPMNQISANLKVPSLKNEQLKKYTKYLLKGQRRMVLPGDDYPGSRETNIALNNKTGW